MKLIATRVACGSCAAKEITILQLEAQISCQARRIGWLLLFVVGEGIATLVLGAALWSAQ